VVNLGARYQLTPRIGILLQVNNLFDREYATASQLGVKRIHHANTSSLALSLVGRRVSPAARNIRGARRANHAVGRRSAYAVIAARTRWVM
jgi:outer membrane receptor protein involved in Fe transport